MSVSTAYGVCDVKSRSVFPDLLPFELEVFLPSQRRIQLAVSQFRTFWREAVTSVPLFELCIIVGMFVLANS